MTVCGRSSNFGILALLVLKRMRNCFHDVPKQLDDVEVEQVILKISFLI